LLSWRRSRGTRESRHATSSAVERKSGDGEEADGLVSRVRRQLDPLDVDIPEQARPSSGPTVGETVVKPGAQKEDEAVGYKRPPKASLEKGPIRKSRP
jgi:hypothetical protein